MSLLLATRHLDSIQLKNIVTMIKLRNLEGSLKLFEFYRGSKGSRIKLSKSKCKNQIKNK